LQQRTGLWTIIPGFGDVMTEPSYRGRSLLDRGIDALIGYDYFISYSHRDGMSYPAQLRAELELHGFKVFLDQTEYVAGIDLRRETWRQIRKSKKVVVSTPEPFLI